MGDGENRKVRIEGVTYTCREIADFLHVPIRHIHAVLDRLRHTPMAPTWAMFGMPKKQP